MESWSWAHPPFHAALEGFGSVVALLLALLLARLERRGEGTSYNGQIIAAVLGLGLLDAFHAATHVGDAFVWLRGSSTFVCGAMAALMWLPRGWWEESPIWFFPGLAVAASIAMASFAGSESLPPMLVEGRYSPAARTLNFAGGFLLLFAVVGLFLSWRKTRRPDDILFCFLGTATGFAAITLAFSELWDATWWISHALRLSANAGGLWFVAYTDSRLQAKAESASRALAELNASLEERVARRTEELEVARDAANAASRAKSEFLANMSHEVRTPLNAVIGLTDVVLRTELDDFQRDHLNTVVESGNSLVQVIKDILDFSKIEAGKVEFERVPISIEDVVCDTLKPLAVRASEKGLDLSCLVQPEVPSLVIGDPTRLRQVITNLVANAIAYTEQGQVLVRVALEREGSQLQISVLDSGVGISSEKTAQIFEAFAQVDSSSTRKYGGTGLGLAICKRLVEMMGGRIEVVSEPGVGSVFSFSIACERAPEADALDARRAALERSLTGQRVLILEPSITERTILSTMFRDSGMRPVTAASSAEEACALLLRAREQGDPIRNVVVTANHPDDEFFGIIGRIGIEEALADAVVLLLTTASPHPALREVDGLRVAGRLMKPVRETELLEALAGARHRSADAGREDRLAERSVPVERRLDLLVVEDSPANQKLAQAILGSVGHAVTVVADGASALARLRERRFDVVLMDIQMPGMDGFQTTAAIRRQEGAESAVPVVAMTAHALVGDREKCLAAGMDAYISKPVRREELLETLQRVARPPQAGAGS